MVTVVFSFFFYQYVFSKVKFLFWFSNDCWSKVTVIAGNIIFWSEKIWPVLPWTHFWLKWQEGDGRQAACLAGNMYDVARNLGTTDPLERERKISKLRWNLYSYSAGLDFQIPCYVMCKCEIFLYSVGICMLINNRSVLPNILDCL